MAGKVARLRARLICRAQDTVVEEEDQSRSIERSDHLDALLVAAQGCKRKVSRDEASERGPR